jgi:hypothetical protein
MKKTNKILLALAIVLSFSTASAQNSIWQRVIIGASFNANNLATYQFGSGFLSNRPNRALNATASVRLWNHLEAGGYLSLMGCSPFGTMVFDDSFARYTWDDNNYNVNGGIFVQLHTASFSQRHNRNLPDFVIRGGFGLNGETDGVWGGFGYEYNITRQLLVSFYVDYGGFAYGNIIDNTFDDNVNWRLCLGLKFKIKQ